MPENNTHDTTTLPAHDPHGIIQKGLDWVMLVKRQRERACQKAIANTKQSTHPLTESMSAYPPRHHLHLKQTIAVLSVLMCKQLHRRRPTTNEA